ncbi:hypothetical protein GACE_1194 [Geoglobus acetivorans]|uniref:Uncharacterized protein n=1 Tax=Geoglobus acetivorans TaxID=565033 RepID=A0A0A7GEF3_GEOAI|nr:hypothetical protein GACE_1194 [Geoglobus acetivorans]
MKRRCFRTVYPGRRWFKMDFRDVGFSDTGTERMRVLFFV